MIPNEQVQRAIAAAKGREARGYFKLVKAGDQRAASLFVRLVANDLNPSGTGANYGWLTKSPGETQVDGYAEDAICYTSDPNDVENVLDLINGAGATGASIGGAVKPRRTTNHWEKPRPLTADEMAYLLDGGDPIPVEPPKPTYPSYEELGGDEGGKKITRILEADYKRAGMRGLDGDCGAWQQRVSYDFLTGKVTPVEAAIAKHRRSWCETLGINE